MRLRGQVALVALALLLVPVVLHAQRFAGNDLIVFRTAAARLLGGADLFPGTDGKYAWRYAPGAALLFAPLNLLSLHAARLAWPAIEAAALVLVVALLQRRLGQRGWWAAPVAALALLRPMLDELHNQNVNALVLLLAAGALLLDDAERPSLAGAALAIATSLKVTPAVLAIDWAVRRRWRSLAALAAGLVAVALVPVATHGPAGALALYRGWLGSEQGSSGRMWGLLENQSLWAMSLAAGWGRAGAVVASAGVLALAVTAPEPRLRAALLLAAAPLVTPYGWIQNFLLALPLVAMLAADARRWVSAGGLALAAALWIPSYDVVGPALEARAEALKIPGLLVVALVIFGRLVGGSPSPRPSPR